MIPQSDQSQQRYRRLSISLLLGAVSVVALVCAVLFFIGLMLNAPPAGFPRSVRIEITEGASLTRIAATLKDRRVITSATFFNIAASLRDVEHRIFAGVYVFPKALSTLELVDALTSRHYLIPPVRLTIPEGSTLSAVDDLAHKLLGLPSGEIIQAYGGREGGLFPDTYFLNADVTGEELVALLADTFREKMAPYADAIAASGFSEEEVVILASILEREANDEESMRIVSGILRSRLSINMPLQVDATFAYLLGKESAELTAEDLSLDSPMNTYENRGLPPSAIGNPGLLAIDAVLNPTPTAYLYYLSDADGNFHYAETFEEHKANKARYLR